VGPRRRIITAPGILQKAAVPISNAVFGAFFPEKNLKFRNFLQNSRNIFYELLFLLFILSILTYKTVDSIVEVPGPSRPDS
ncbi:MAG: hypothetical protein Q4G68_12085, partial [Planctomycetia bacterium]|nr:hypothetical protein [Planctomycetia bacterium]